MLKISHSIVFVLARKYVASDPTGKLFHGLGGVKTPQTASSSLELEAQGMIKN
jgi:hypothetical protein